MAYTCQTCSISVMPNTAINPAASPRPTSENSITGSRGQRSTSAPASKLNTSMGTVLKINTVPITTDEPVFSTTHQISATRNTLSPSREMVCPPHSKAKGFDFNARNVECDIGFPYFQSRIKR